MLVLQFSVYMYIHIPTYVGNGIITYVATITAFISKRISLDERKTFSVRVTQLALYRLGITQTFFKAYRTARNYSCIKLGILYYRFWSLNKATIVAKCTMQVLYRHVA